MNNDKIQLLYRCYSLLFVNINTRKSIQFPREQRFQNLFIVQAQTKIVQKFILNLTFTFIIYIFFNILQTITFYILIYQIFRIYHLRKVIKFSLAQTMISLKSLSNSFFNLLGYKIIKLEKDIHLHRLGKQCSQCKKAILHRQAISVCQCYYFAHRECLINQMQRQNIGECTRTICSSCNDDIRIETRFQFHYEPKVTIKQLLLLILYTIICIFTVMYLINFKNEQLLQLTQKDMQLKAENKKFSQNNLSVNKQKQQNMQLPFVTFEEVLVMVVLSIFGSAFWLGLIGIFFKRRNLVIAIATSNIQLKVSAFEDLQNRIRQQSQQEILVKRQQSDEI